MTRLSQSAARTDASGDRPRLASWYTPGLSDAIGDRLLMFDNSTASPLELLRFRPELWKHPRFEDALRRRIAELAGFNHPSIATVRAVESLDNDDGLTLVSNQTVGRRLAEIRHQARGPQFATELVRQLLPVLVALHQQGGNTSHGLLTPERVVLSPEGRLVLTEHVLGPAIDALGLSSEALRELGVIVPTSSTTVTDPRVDLAQLGYLALSLLVGHMPDSFDAARDIVRRISHPSVGAALKTPAFLQSWLARALQVEEPFESASDAQLALATWLELDMGNEERVSTSEHTAIGGPVQTPASAVLQTSRELTFEQTASLPVDEQVLKGRVLELPDRSRPSGAEDVAPMPLPDARLGQAAGRATFEQIERPAASPRFHSRWLAAAWALVFIESITILLLLSNWPSPSTGVVSAAAAAPPTSPTSAMPSPAPARAGLAGWLDISSDPTGARVAIDDKPAGTTPLLISTAPGAHTIAIAIGEMTTRRTVDVKTGTTATVIAALATAPAGATGGWLTIDTPLDLQVFEGSTLIGTTKARLMLPAGRRELRLVSSALAFERSISVEVQAGRTTTTRVEPPNGTVSLNALPWANVFLDGQALGTTPVANISTPIGLHEVIWRHPQLGERRQTVVVTVKTPARLVVDLRE